MAFHRLPSQGFVQAQDGTHFRAGPEDLLLPIVEGGPGSLAESPKWFRCAAEQGEANAQTCMGIRYCSGRGVPKDLRQGEAGGNPDAARLGRQLRIWFSPAQIAKADRLAAEALKRRPHGGSRGDATP